MARKGRWATISHEEIEEHVKAFQKAGGKIRYCYQGETGEKIKPLRNHAKKLAERKQGIYSDKEPGSGDTPWRRETK